MLHEGLSSAIQKIRAGEVVALPTETVYGLAARIDHPESIRMIFSLKERPFFDPLIVHVGSRDQAKSLVTWWPEEAQRLSEVFWPGPLTLVLPKKSSLDPTISSGLETVALRWPHHPLFQAVLDGVQVPLAAPSANKFGRTSPTTADHVRSEFPGQNVFVLDGGASSVGIESTVLLLRKKENDRVTASVLRKGSIHQIEIEKALEGFPVDFEALKDKGHSPGEMKHHYMPSIPLVISMGLVDKNLLIQMIEEKIHQLPDKIESVSIQKPKGKVQKIEELKLSPTPALAAREFYSELRRLSQLDNDVLVFNLQDHHKEPAWEALMDRMHKAASLILP